MANLPNSGQIDTSLALNTNFRVIIERLPTISFFSTDVILPGVSLPPMDVISPYQAIPIQADTLVWEEMKLDFLVDAGFFAYVEVLNWILQTVSANDPTSAAVIYSDASVMALDNNKQEIIKFKFHDCWPTALGSLTYNTDEESRRLQCSLTLKYTQFVPERILDLQPPITPPLEPSLSLL